MFGSTDPGELPLHTTLFQQGKTAILFQLTSDLLISIGKFCDDNCLVTFDKSKMCVYKNRQEIMRDICNPNDGLWDIPLPTRKFSPTPNTHHNSLHNKKYHAIHMVASHPSLSVIIRKDTTKVDLARYYTLLVFPRLLARGKKPLTTTIFPHGQA